MLERYAEDSRKVILLARYEASRLGSSVLEAEHLWLGLLREQRRLIKRLAPHITLPLIEHRLAARGPAGERVSMAADLALSPTLIRVFAAAQQNADQRKQIYLNAEHLVLALLGEEAQPA